MSARSYLKRLVNRRKKPNLSASGGFTLIELLISLLIGGLLVTGLLTIIIDFLKIDSREVALEQAQQDMARALDYIADDMRESVYVYSNPGIVAAELTDLPAGATPVLAFWRPDPVDITDLPANCTAFGDPLEEDECDVLKIRQATYSLVMYLHRDDDAGDETWVGPSQILRYELEKYDDVGTLDQNDGYIDPTGVAASFSAWARDGATTDGNGGVVLVDLLDDQTAALDKSPLNDGPACSSFGADYLVVPNTATINSSTNFFACVRDPASGVAGDAGSSNQDVYVFLRGTISNALNDTIELGALRDSDSALPTLETQVLIRGVIEKNPVN